MHILGNLVVEIRARRQHIMRSAEKKQTSPYGSAQKLLNSSRAVDEYLDTEVALVSRITGATRHLVMPK
jgi:hypothetical protein